MSELEDIVRQAGDLIRADNDRIARSVAASGEYQRMKDEMQSRAAVDLHKFLEQYEASQKEQAKENKVNRWIAVISMLVAVGSLIVSLVK